LPAAAVVFVFPAEPEPHAVSDTAIAAAVKTLINFLFIAFLLVNARF